MEVGDGFCEQLGQEVEVSKVEDFQSIWVTHRNTFRSDLPCPLVCLDMWNVNSMHSRRSLRFLVLHYIQ